MGHKHGELRSRVYSTETKVITETIALAKRSDVLERELARIENLGVNAIVKANADLSLGHDDLKASSYHLVTSLTRVDTRTKAALDEAVAQSTTHLNQFTTRLKAFENSLLTATPTAPTFNNLHQIPTTPTTDGPVDRPPQLSVPLRHMWLNTTLHRADASLTHLSSLALPITNPNHSRTFRIGHRMPAHLVTLLKLQGICLIQLCTIPMV